MIASLLVAVPWLTFDCGTVRSPPCFVSFFSVSLFFTRILFLHWEGVSAFCLYSTRVLFCSLVRFSVPQGISIVPPRLKSSWIMSVSDCQSAQSIHQSLALLSSLVPAARYLALAERHMVCCVQLHLMRPTFDAGATPGDGSNGLEGTLVRAIILCVCTVSASFEVRALHAFQLLAEYDVRLGEKRRRFHRDW